MAELVEAAEAVEDVITGVTKISAGIAVGVGVAVGVGIGYFVAEKKLRTKYEEVANQEISEMREHFHAKVIAMEGKPALDGLVEDLGYVKAPIPQKEQVAGTSLNKARDIAAQDPQTEEEKAFVENEIIQENVFDQSQVEDNWDYETEVKSRTPDYPYVIHIDEQGELPELDQLSFTYYEGDEILANEREEAVTDVEAIVGLSNLDKFGHGSGDANIVHVRNVKLGVEIEIIRSHGRFDEEVLGLKHADETIHRRKARFDDER